MKNISVVLVACLTLVACASSPALKVDARECERNFTKQGYKNFKTSVILVGVDKKTAIRELVRDLGRKGFTITANDADQGMVSGTFDAGDSGLSLSAFIDEAGADTNVELNYKVTGAGMVSMLVPESAYANEMCSMVEAMD